MSVNKYDDAYLLCMESVLLQAYVNRVANGMVPRRNHIGPGPISKNQFYFDLEPVLLVPNLVPIEKLRSSSGTGST